MDTIAGISTPQGKGGISVVRLSGASALSIALLCVVGVGGKSGIGGKACEKMGGGGQVDKGKRASDSIEIKPRYAYLCEVKTKHFSDKCILIYFKAPHSYTGEDIVEFQLHGSNAIANGVLAEVLAKGARLAENGEFSMRAVLNGKMSITEAEGVASLINAQTAAQIRAGYSLSSGHLQKRVLEIEGLLYSALAPLEASIAYTQEEIGEVDLSGIPTIIEKARQALLELDSAAGVSDIIENGISVTLVGRPNVGKSSLFNALVGADRAIVTDIAGTTRDVISESFVYNDVVFNLSDTAGIRQVTDQIEILGIQKTRDTIKGSQIILLVLDSTDITKDDQQLLEQFSGLNLLVVLNKVDKAGKTGAKFKNAIRVSANTKQGLDKLKEQILVLANAKGLEQGDTLYLNSRHKNVVKKALEHLGTIKQAGDLETEVLFFVVKNALQEISKISGKDFNTELANEIFSKFCIGK
ncbi:MAG: tRNA uridine-5-carboxymethylaminomethyl(34) synthesis GTPase MnmE [Firmicutes bacterium]|nr:tRNA uridine-5-carboxymethylaminomethyl(34) synthesis GTPase MnmE [Bacillota bacterium]